MKEGVASDVLEGFLGTYSCIERVGFDPTLHYENDEQLLHFNGLLQTLLSVTIVVVGVVLEKAVSKNRFHY